MTAPTLEDLARRAVAGDRGAVAGIVRELERPISRVEHAKRVVEVHRTTHPRGPSRDTARLVIAMLEPVVPE